MDVAEDFFNMKIGHCSKNEAINMLINYYEDLPEPRIKIKNSYLFVRKICELALEEKDFDLAEKWGVIGLQYDGIHGLLGEQNFFLGKVYFAKGDFEKAKEYFTKVYKNSKLRLFKDKNPEYQKLINK